ncbi:VWFA-related protein [Granulicella aggregans]|uniref:VWFA-related protein n=1 Tax=Granulicella aggregans TaxID=474949 RepID=A0A7W7ZJU3_9BACT|nr:VWA domain-containing protein [Granulicella aggregans]MBB5061048.1 VWFA-related protein [Granulicella aggregans]
MNLRAAIAIGCMTLAAQESFVLAQLSTPQGSQTPSLTAHSTLVLVPALVRTKSGNLVFTLTFEDFVLTDDGVPQKLTLEQDAGGEPLAVVLAVETGGAGARELDKLGALAPMIESVVGNIPHKIAVVAFDSKPALTQDFTPSTEATAAAIHDLSSGDDGAAILDGLGFSVDLLRKQPSEYRRAILLISESVDRGSHLKLEDALRTISDTNTAIYSVGFSTGRSEAAHYGSRELPTQRIQSNGSWLALENPNSNPSNGCMGKETSPDSGNITKGQRYDCLALLAPPLAIAKMAAIAATDGLRRNIPETVANLTGGEYFKLTDSKSLARSLKVSPTTSPIATS